MTPGGLIPGYVALILLSAAASALGCFLLARRYAFSRARCIGWAVVGFVFGWVGLVLMLVLQEWPARISCPKCRKLRVVTREACEHCGALHAVPAPTARRSLSRWRQPRRPRWSSDDPRFPLDTLSASDHFSDVSSTSGASSKRSSPRNGGPVISWYFAFSLHRPSSHNAEDCRRMG